MISPAAAAAAAAAADHPLPTANRQLPTADCRLTQRCHSTSLTSSKQLKVTSIKMKNLNQQTGLQADLLPLMKAADIGREIGKHMHIIYRSTIPSYIEIREIEDEKWPALISRIEETLEWDKNHKTEIEEYDHANRKVSFYCLHLVCGITLFKKSYTRSVILYYDQQTDMQILQDLRKKIESVTKEPSDTEIGYLMIQAGTLFIKQREFRPYENDLVRFMGEETEQFRIRMVKNLKMKHQSGLYLLHGKPGTGKTSFIKSVIARVDKPVIFLTPALTDNLTSPDLIGVLMENPDSILIIEDAETVLMKRQGDNSNAVANLLNLTDGFPADFLNLSIICTFNTGLDNIDPALLREGRLKGIHQFQKLQPGQVKKLAEFLGLHVEPDGAMTLAEVWNGREKKHSLLKNGIGF